MKRTILLSLAVLILTEISVFAGGTGKSAKEGKAIEGIDAAKLWAQTCTRCHNARPATSYSDAQWDVIVHHMRIRANLTGTEAKAIADFLKDAN